MPELPEVQTTVDGINRTVKGLTIVDVWTSYGSRYFHGKDNIKDPTYFSSFKKSVVGKKIKNASRRAKNILIRLESGEPVILIHMKMTGHIMYGDYFFDKHNLKDPWRPHEKDIKGKEQTSLLDPFNRHIRFVLTLSNGRHLVLSDMRKFAKITLLQSVKDENIHLHNIGPEPLDEDFTFQVFTERLSRRPAARIKSALIDQTLIAGVGNIYSDEALWRAGIHPEERVGVLIKKGSKGVEEKLKKLYSSVKDVLKSGIDFGGDSMSDYRNIYGERGAFQEHHLAYRRTGKKCTLKGCAGTIKRKVVGGRSAHFCDTHQKMLGR